MDRQIYATIDTSADEAPVDASSLGVRVRIGAFMLLLTADAAQRLSNDLQDAVDELGGQVQS